MAIVPASIRMRIVCMSLLLLEDGACFEKPVTMVKALATRRPKMSVSLLSPDQGLPKLFSEPETESENRTVERRIPLEPVGSAAALVVLRERPIPHHSLGVGAEQW